MNKPKQPRKKRNNLNTVAEMDVMAAGPSYRAVRDCTLISVRKNGLTFFAIAPPYMVDEYLVAVDKTAHISSEPAILEDIPGKRGTFFKGIYFNV